MTTYWLLGEKNLPGSQVDLSVPSLASQIQRPSTPKQPYCNLSFTGNGITNSSKPLSNSTANQQHITASTPLLQNDLG